MDNEYDMIEALNNIASALEKIGSALYRLGFNDEHTPVLTPMGTLELISATMENGFQKIADSIAYTKVDELTLAEELKIMVARENK